MINIIIDDNEIRRPEEFGKLVAEVVTSAKNGSVWVLNRGIARDVTPQNEWLRY